jgi:hypothetical protein
LPQVPAVDACSLAAPKSAKVQRIPWSSGPIVLVT